MFSRVFQLSLLLAAVFMLASVHNVLQAAEEAPEEVSEKEEKAMSVREKVADFIQDFDDASEQHFLALYGSYNMISVVEGVQEQLGDAVEQCVDANPDMKEALTTRYEEWNAAINPVLEDARGNVDNMIAVQEYTKPRKIRKLLKFVDKKRKNDRDVETFPVTSVEGCEYMRKKMSDTQTNLTRLLESTLVSLPQALIRQQQEDDAKAKAEAEAEAQESKDTKAE